MHTKHVHCTSILTGIFNTSETVSHFPVQRKPRFRIMELALRPHFLSLHHQMGPQCIALKIPWCLPSPKSAYRVPYTPYRRCVMVILYDYGKCIKHLSIMHSRMQACKMWLCIESKSFLSRNTGHARKGNSHRLVPKPHRSENPITLTHTHTNRPPVGSELALLGQFTLVLSL